MSDNYAAGVGLPIVHHLAANPRTVRVNMRGTLGVACAHPEA